MKMPSQSPPPPPPSPSTATRVAKDLAESKCLRLESDLKATEERQHQLEERNSKLCKSLEEVHRAAAWQGRNKLPYSSVLCSNTSYSHTS